VLVRRIVSSNTRCIQNPDFQDNSNTSLHLAASLGHADIVSYLIDAGHEEECICRNTAGATPLMLAVEAGHEEPAQILAVRFPRCIPWKNKLGMDALMLAARQGSPGMITAFLSLTTDRKTLLEAADKDGNVALHFASAFGNLKCVMLLLQAGAQPDRMNAKSWQPVHYSSTVSAEVFFKNAVAELEKRRSEDREREKEMERRKEGGVRVVTEDDWESGPEAARQALTAGETGRTTPTSLRGVPVRPPFANRMRSESAE
jgi:ankyrin repeat protein